MKLQKAYEESSRKQYLNHLQKLLRAILAGKSGKMKEHCRRKHPKRPQDDRMRTPKHLKLRKQKDQ